MLFGRNVSFLFGILFSFCFVSGLVAKSDVSMASEGFSRATSMRNLSDEDTQAIMLKIDELGQYMAEQFVKSQKKQEMSLQELETEMKKYIDEKIQKAQINNESREILSWKLVALVAIVSGSGMIFWCMKPFIGWLSRKLS